MARVFSRALDGSVGLALTLARNWIAVALLVAGSAVLLLSYQEAEQARAFADAAITSKAEVVDFRLSRTSPRNGSETVYHPVFRFKDPSGRAFTVASSSGSSPPRYALGEKLTVYYLPSAPDGARPSLWTWAPIGWAIGGLLCSLGVYLVFRRRREAGLAISGVAIQTDFRAIHLNRSLAVNGASPWRVLTEGKDPNTGLIRAFWSENLWSDPTPYIPASRKIPVFIDQGNSKRFTMDLSFLAEAVPVTQPAEELTSRTALRVNEISIAPHSYRLLIDGVQVHGVEAISWGGFFTKVRLSDPTDSLLHYLQARAPGPGDRSRVFGIDLAYATNDFRAEERFSGCVWRGSEPGVLIFVPGSRDSFKVWTPTVESAHRGRLAQREEFVQPVVAPTRLSGRRPPK